MELSPTISMLDLRNLMGLIEWTHMSYWDTLGYTVLNNQGMQLSYPRKYKYNIFYSNKK